MCADIMVGDDMRRGISGGEKKRVTTGMFPIMRRKLDVLHDVTLFFK